MIWEGEGLKTFLRLSTERPLVSEERARVKHIRQKEGHKEYDIQDNKPERFHQLNAGSRCLVLRFIKMSRLHNFLNSETTHIRSNEGGHCTWIVWYQQVSGMITCKALRSQDIYLLELPRHVLVSSYTEVNGIYGVIYFTSSGFKESQNISQLYNDVQGSGWPLKAF